ncbi:MAG: HAMP domain-containing histidine kinase [Desulfobulbaceae bacterium]|nr:HAMP domain-containing histidine kinase [Desulfobulbaceae bacterium]
MSSKRIRRSSAAVFLQSAAICLFFFVLLLPAALLTLRLTIQQVDKNLCETTFSSFLSIYRQQGSPGLQKQFAAIPHRKTTFLRLQSKRSHLLLLSDIHGGPPTELPDFRTLDTTLSGIWVQLDQQSPEYWTIRQSSLPNGDILQVGIRSTDGVLFYNRLKKNLLFTWLFLAPIAALPAWFMFRHNQKALTRLARKIERTAQGEDKTPSGWMQLPPGEQGLLQAVSHLTERHQALVQQLQETMDNVAHDLRTPLARLRTIAEYGLQEQGDPKQLRERLTDCLEESDRILSMLNTMLNVAEAEAKSMVLDLQPRNLREVIEQVVELYTIVAEEKNCSLIVHDSEPVMALVDPNRIGQVWANLIDNAIKYGATKVEITLRQENSRAVVTVYDNGMGISETEKDQIWNRLFRGDRSRSQPGLGLGLTLVRAIIHAHAGSITVDSKLNTATTFTVKLPQPPPT